MYDKAIGVWMVVQRTDNSVDTVGDIISEPYQLKLIRPSNPNKNYLTWQLMWRNCYAIPRGIGVEDMDLKIYKGAAGTEKTTSPRDYQEASNQTQSYLEILGLDQYNSTDQKIPDGRLDDRAEMFRPEWGLLIFPERQPFNSQRTFVDLQGHETMPLALTVPQIYSFSDDNDQIDASQYFLRLSTRTRSSIINLNRSNIIAGSERITVNARALMKDTDYTIDYNFCRITLLSPEATDPNGEISVDYEYAPFLAVQKKTLLGMRAEYDWSQDFQIGSTVLYKSDQAQERKPRVGQETSKMVVYDVDATLKVQPSFVTKALDALPFYQTEAASGMTISGELAQSHPNPNVEGSAYVDDFESALEQLSLGVNRTIWQPASLPKHIDANNYLRGKVLWHQPRDAVSTTDVYDVKTGRGEGSIRTMRMVFRPHHDSVAVAYNADTTGLVYNTLPGSYHSWGGIMRYFHNRVDASRVQLFEIRMRGSRRGRLHFDFGRITEDANGNDQIDSEVDSEEPLHLPGINVDPSGDNWYFLGEGKCPLPADSCDRINWDDESVRYEWLNGTEGNIGDISVLGYPDKEQLNTSGFNESDAYFSFVINLADDKLFLVEGSEKPSGDTVNPWRTYRIPVLDTLAQDAVVSTAQIVPNWANISHVRVWFDDTTQSTFADTVEIADWYFVQSNWRDSIDVHDRSRELTENQQTKFVVASVSEEDGTFSPHPDVEAYKDPATGLTEPQRALLMSFQDLNHFDTCLAIKELLEVDKYSGYRRMEMYVHGGTGITLDPNGQQPIGLFMRLGQDSANFYEVRNDVYPGWDQRNNVDIDFNELTAVKDSLIRDAAKGEERNIDGTSGRYRVKGAPNLNEIRYFVVGVVNHDIVDTVGGATADIWLDELRVSDVRKDVGTAARISVNGTLADLLNYGFGYQTIDPYFRQVSSATRGGGDNNLGSGKTQTNYNYNLTFNLDRFTPKSWGMRLPISYSYAKSTTIPLLRTSSDIVLPDDVRDLEKTVSESRNFSV
ncbi:MAG: cell surface protein SprA, partial [Chitinivibrionia bacterium]|nr:cell surface protein SprA [Chitinivibrionia bacterium]